MRRHTITIARLDRRASIEPFGRPLSDPREVSTRVYPRGVDIVLLQTAKPLRRDRSGVRIAHDQLSQVIDAMCFVHGSIDGVLRIDVGIDRHAQMVQTVQVVQSIEPSYVAAVMDVPVSRWVGPIGFARFVVREEEVATLR